MQMVDPGLQLTGPSGSVYSLFFMRIKNKEWIISILSGSLVRPFILSILLLTSYFG
jgi:hypothetical protein